MTAFPEEAGWGDFTAGALPLDTPGITVVPDPLADEPVFALLPELELSVLLVSLLPELPLLPLLAGGVVAVSVWLVVSDDVPGVPCAVLDVSCANADPMMAARHSVIVLRRK